MGVRVAKGEWAEEVKSVIRSPNAKALLVALIVAAVVFLAAQAFSERLFLLFLPLVFIGGAWWKWPNRRD